LLRINRAAKFTLLIGVVRAGKPFAQLGAVSAAGANAMVQSLRKFILNESGATAIEYALIASLIAIAIIAGLTALGTRLSTTFGEVSSNLK
jgi:pilus assembly protein Flp/PilA